MEALENLKYFPFYFNNLCINWANPGRMNINPRVFPTKWTVVNKMPENSTAFEATEKYCQVDCDSKYEWGAFVTTIDYLEENTSKGKYWLYFINGDFSPVSAGAYELSHNDKIEWKYGEEYNQ